MMKLLLVFALTCAAICFSGCGDSTGASVAAPVNDEKAMKLASDGFTAQNFQHLYDPAWMKGPVGTGNLVCQLAIVEKHNRKYPYSQWQATQKELEDAKNHYIGHDLSESDQLVANACAEEAIQQAQKTIALSDAFAKR